MGRYRLTLNSPLLICEGKVDSNIIKSVEYISGDRIRAAFAKEILLQCPLFCKGEKRNGRYNWVCVRNQNRCRVCSYFTLCNNFSKIRFSFFYPEGTQVIPLSTVKYKCSIPHGFKDNLVGNINNNDNEKCKVCGGRTESVYGLRSGKNDFRAEKIMIEKTAIDSFTLTSQDGQLYTLIALADRVKNGNSVEKTAFTGNVLLQGENNSFSIKPIYDLRVGAYNSVGFGNANIEEMEEEPLRDTRSMIEEFNKRVKNSNGFETNNYLYLPILFKSHTKLGIEKIPRDKLVDRNTDFKKLWKGLLVEEHGNDQRKRGFDFKFDVEKIYSETQVYRGYDTSLTVDEEPREEPIIINKMGTTLLLKIHRNEFEKALLDLKKAEQLGIGYETENGFGQIEVCNELHLKGEI